MTYPSYAILFIICGAFGKHMRNKDILPGSDTGFLFRREGGGAQKKMCSHAHHKREGT